MIKLKPLVTEDPHSVNINGKQLSWFNDDYAFIYIIELDVAFIKADDTHNDLFSHNSELSKYFKEKTKLDSDEYVRGEYPEYFIEGRFWKKDKVISFWEYPKKDLFLKVINAIKLKGININNDWNLEVYKYVGSDDIEHINISPDITRDDINKGMLISHIIKIGDYK